MTEKIWHLKNCRIFEQLSATEIERLDACSRVRRFAKRSPIYLPAERADTVLLLASGRVKICHLTPEGKQSILAFIEPGELFGELSILDGEARDEYAEAVEASMIVSIPKEAMHELMESRPGLSIGVTKLIGLRRRRIERRVKNLLFLSNRDRLAHLLLELAESYGKRTEDGVELEIRLSHQDLANIVGSTRETVTVVLGELQNDGLVKVGRRRIVLRSLQRLAHSVQAPEPRIPEAPESQVAEQPSLRFGFGA
ncbi:Crp/Fnr family transcriptional regulator [Blastopirellula retiformator]|uniref:Global nitrogen regulator n=1 Tax=Blastopirellula retiformator TaxID=2527970 RepID=A0A5C5UTU9_9BACT|nr:Crp/Fnr family transcriptional regulator [Blastopirellula retiformator]TWT29488.1 Global nitrogen regulator [Blastopirellula retiformator]